MNKLGLSLFSALGVLLITACATAPQQSDQVDRARAETATLAQDPLAQQAAGEDLKAAQDRLQQAEQALHDGRPLTEVDHYAYLSQRHAEAGEARVQQARAQQEIARARDDRNRILLAQRAREEAAARNEATAERNKAQADADAARAQLADAQQQLADLKAQQTERGTVLTLGDVLFDTGQATLKPGADLSLNRLAAYLKAHPQTRILIEGHTDSRGSDAYNDALSERRAQAVATALISRGIPEDAVRAVGRGKAYPIASNDTEAGRQQNRRVEIVLSDNSGRFAEGEASEPPPH
jgi:outer membrane protein OmpA-like peptidoglycan-associated protein